LPGSPTRAEQVIVSEWSETPPREIEDRAPT
jgi:hypothetical protein